VQVNSIPWQKILLEKYLQLTWDGVFQQSIIPLPATLQDFKV
jgi:hypothetical protein